MKFETQEGRSKNSMTTYIILRWFKFSVENTDNHTHYITNNYTNPSGRPAGLVLADHRFAYH